MPRPIAYPDFSFIKNLPSNEEDAITINALSERVGCHSSLAARRVKGLAERGLVLTGKPTNMGAVTWYKAYERPEMQLPHILDGRGVRQSIKTWVKVSLDDNIEDLNKRISKPLLMAILHTWVNANDDEVNFTETNQDLRVEIMRFRGGVKALLNTIDSYLNDPYLSGTDEEVNTAKEAIRSVSADINLDEVVDRCNALRRP